MDFSELRPILSDPFLVSCPAGSDPLLFPCPAVRRSFPAQPYGEASLPGRKVKPDRGGQWAKENPAARSLAELSGTVGVLISPRKVSAGHPSAAQISPNSSLFVRGVTASGTAL